MEQYLQLGAVAIIFALAIREFFSYLKSRKNGNGLSQQIKLVGENHLEHIQQAIERQTDNNNEWHRKQFEILCKISGKLK